MGHELELGRARLWTVEDVARYLNTSASWVYRQAEGRKLPHTRLGSMLRFDEHEIKAHVAQGMVGPVMTTTGTNVVWLDRHRDRQREMRRAAMLEEARTSAADRGSFWHCSECGSLNHPSRVRCHECNGPVCLPEGA